MAINPLGMAPEGWSVVLEDSGILSDCNGLDYVLDLVSELELCPAFPIDKYDLLKAGTKRSSDEHIFIQTSRPQVLLHFSKKLQFFFNSPYHISQVPPPEPPQPTTRKLSQENMSAHLSSRKSSRETSTHEYSPQRESPKISNSPARKTSHEALSRNSALNERYFEVEKVRSRSLDNLLSSDQEANPLATLGLSQSRLNDRYHSVEQLAPIEPVIAASSYIKQEIEFEYPDVSSISTSNRGGPRYIKSQYVGKKAPPGSHSSRAQIEKSELGVRSSAMSDTSETPSLASHVRRVRVPSQASDVDQFLDELFSPVLDGNLDELSDARSLAASIKGGGEFINDINIHDNLRDLTDANKLVARIKGGGNRNRTSSRSSSMLDHEVESLTSSQQQATNSGDNGNVDDYINNIFRPIFINDNVKSEKNGDHLKNGSTNQEASSSNNFPALSSGVITPQNMILPMLNQENRLPVQFGNVQGFNLPSGTDINSYQQNLQRAFLQSAMAQNIQIQQQLLAQNQALQTLLSQQGTVDVKTVTETTVHAQVHQPQNGSPNRKASFNKSNNFSRKSSSPSSNEYKNRKPSSESNISVISRNGGMPPPPPPPLPPPLDPSDPSEVRPFLDPYGRAKTVRIGKWRWPPPKDSATNENGEDFMHFKMRQQNRKVTPSKEQIITQPSAEWEEIDFDSPTAEKNSKSNNRRSFEVGASRPSPGSIGKLKLSSEMRQRLELVTANHSVRSTSSKVEQPARVVNKLEDTRKLMLEQQLRGRWDSVDAPSESPSPENLKQIDSKSPTQQSWNSSSWRPVPPPPPIGPNSLPPAPSGPAPPPPIRPPPAPVEPIRDSFMAQRQDRDTFGVHQNAVIHTSSKRNSFSANWEVSSSTVHDSRDEVSNWAKEGIENEKQDGRISTQSSNWDQTESSNMNSEIVQRNISIISRESWEVETKPYNEKTKHMNYNKENVERPTFRTHQMNRSQQEREKKHSVSTQNTDKQDKLEGNILLLYFVTNA